MRTAAPLLALSPLLTLTVVLGVLPAPAQTPPPAAAPVTADCAQHAATHVLVRKDVFVRLDAAEQNLVKAEAALRQAQADLIALKAAADELQRQKGVLKEHIVLLEKLVKAQPGPSPVEVAEDLWEWADAPLAFVAGTGMCLGLAWGLNQATR